MGQEKIGGMKKQVAFMTQTQLGDAQRVASMILTWCIGRKGWQGCTARVVGLHECVVTFLLAISNRTQEIDRRTDARQRFSRPAFLAKSTTRPHANHFLSRILSDFMAYSVGR